MLDIIATQLKLKNLEVAAQKAGIAIVDDDASFSFMLKDYLMSSAGLKSDIFSTGEDFLKEYKSNDERKIILDYDLGPGINGIEVLTKVKTINPLASVIIVSGQDDLETAIETMRKGAIDYFLKTNKSVFANILSSLMKIIEMDNNRWN